MLSDGWTVRLQQPADHSVTRALLLLHGWTGDETVMWIFTRKLAPNYWIFAPRGPVKAPGGGYGWTSHDSADRYSLASLEPVVHRLAQSIPVWMEQAGLPSSAANLPFDLMGFSQGAVMSFAVQAFYPERVRRVAALAGFFPAAGERADLLDSFQGKQVYIAHGTQDETVPVEKAQEAVRLLQQHGADVTYCESETGHKLSAPCLRGLEAFFNAERTPPDR